MACKRPFHNLVDESDLLAIMDGDKRQPFVPAPVEIAPEPLPEEEPEPKKNNTGTLLIMLLLVGTLGGGAFYYFKVLKPKHDAKGAVMTELDEFIFDEDEDDFDSAASYEPEGAEHEENIPEEPVGLDNNEFNFDLGDFDTPESEGR